MAEKKRPPIEVIDLTEDDNHPPKRSKVSYSDVWVVDAPTQAPVPIESTNRDVTVVGVKNQVKLPHMRQHCTEFSFIGDHKAVCDSCYCYICDVLVKDCVNWNIHCHATDKGPQADYYKQLRRNHKNGTTITPRNSYLSGIERATPRLPIPNPRPTPSDLQAELSDALLAERPVAPLPPSTQNVHPRYTQCRHCHWYSILYSRGKVYCYDWCSACGRVAKYSALGDDKGKEFKFPSTKEYLYLGSKKIVYRAHSHDPRVMKQFKKYYDEHKFPFSDLDTAEEFVKHRLGKYTNLSTVLDAIPVGGTGATIPEDGLFGVSRDRPQSWSADETQALLIKPEDLTLLQAMHNSNCNFGKNNCYNTTWLSGDMKNNYDRDKKTGSTDSSPSSKLQMAKFLGVWYGVFPLELPEIKLHLDVESSPKIKFVRPNERVQKALGLSETKMKQASKQAAKRVKICLKANRNYVETSRKEHHSLQSGTGSNMGGICLASTDFRGMMVRLFREIVAECVALNSHGPHLTQFLSSELNTPSCHRMYGDFINRQSLYSLCPFLGPEDAELVALGTYKAGMDLVNRRVKSLNGIVDQLENLGHAPAPFVGCAMTVELLPFQSQSLQWALERELTPGGVQSFFWTKLPKSNVYYSPILGHLTVEKPNLVRGGIIAEQMNRAPVTPESGSCVSTIPNQSTGNGAFRDPNLYSLTKKINKKRGSIVSRGTLVVCNVSLVGQWVEEAKSKLKDPGLVYSYHGGSRKRDPKILAQNAIVVTTYETLASDSAFHRKKSNTPDYCAPCEQIRWWRIICDESHVLRSPSNVKFQAVMELVADNKWLVSGTPLSTTVMDLKSQLKFLGIQHHGQMMDLFKQTFFHRTNDPCRPGRRDYSGDQYSPGLGYFQFFMRQLMMRHSQNQTYSNTTTTLMSLPPKFSQQEVSEYKKLESAAQAFYTDFIGRHGGEVTKHYFKLAAKLVPLRVACAGGQVPLDDPAAEKDKGDEIEEDDFDEDQEENQGNGKKKGKKEQRYSELAFTSKLQMLIAELIRLRDTDASAKSLVFSQYTSTLKCLQQELPKHGFQFRTLSGKMSMRARAKALQDFQNDPPTTIFLLSMRSGAVGINLTQANRVFIMEPSFNPALEAQAIGRVHRLGQKRPVEIIRLVVKDSVETRIQKMLTKKFGNSLTRTSKPPPDTEEAVDDSAEEDRKPAAKPSVQNQQQVNVGSICTDKLKIMTDEFDILFGVAGHGSSSPPAASNSLPDKISSNNNSI